MCGLNGIFAYGRSAPKIRREELLATREHMRSRGPDSAGEWWSGDADLALGHRRLSILDLSERANQPMCSVSGRYVIAFNGEIYNAPSLRRELEREGHVFQTTSDTEVILELYAARGSGVLNLLRGMFAIAIWDNVERRVFLARDPYGIKPLYTSCDGQSFRFASQVKALIAGGAVALDPEPAGVVGFHIWGHVPEPYTLYRQVRALPAGHFQIVDRYGPKKPERYASVAEVFHNGAARPGSIVEIGERVRDAVRDSVEAHLLADVEVGLFLSAGIDSGALLGLMRDAGVSTVRAITLGFEEFGGTADDEAPLASEVAARYGAQHIVRTVNEREFQADLPNILDGMDQPSIDGVNTWFVAKAAREAGLKVALSGVGGDELLGGYPSFADVPRLASWMRLPAAVPGAGRAARYITKALGLAARSPKSLGLVEFGGSYAGAYLLRRALFLPFELEAILDPEIVEVGLQELSPVRRVQGSMDPAAQSPISRVATLESSNYLRNQLLRDSDWAGMAHSLEIRTPLVDFDLLRRVSDLVPHFGAQVGKAALAAAPRVSLPDLITRRAKTGFRVPTGRWIATTLEERALGQGAVSRAWARKLLGQWPDVRPFSAASHRKRLASEAA